MRILFLFTLLIIPLITACSDDDTPAITKNETPSVDPDPDSKPALIEKEIEEDDEEKVEMVLEFQLPEEQVTINLNRVNILREYLSNVEDRQLETDKMTLRPLEVPAYDTLYLLEFSCYNDYCSYLLLDQYQDGRSYLVEDISKFKQALVSPNNDKILLVFERYREIADRSILTHKLAVMDLEEWINPSFKNNPEFKDYQWPIQHIIWESDSSLSVTLPDIEAPTEQNLESWYHSEQSVKNIELELETDK